jgi:hypothetical protein
MTLEVVVHRRNRVRAGGLSAGADVADLDEHRMGL